MPRYRAVEELMYPADASVIARLRAGERISLAQRGIIRTVHPGEEADDIPRDSVGWLLAQGLIVLVEETAPAAEEA